MPRQTHVQEEKKRTKRASEIMEEQSLKRDSNPALTEDLDALLAEIDEALQGVDKNLAVKYVQLGGE